MDCSIHYYIKNKLVDITTYSTLLSIAGAILVANPEKSFRLAGFVIWTISNGIWTIYFRNTKQYNPMVLFIIYLVYGVMSNW
jgi:hypothetical protein